jgi:hypothetical protein
MTSRLMLFRDIIAIYSENRKKQTADTHSVGNVQSYQILKQVVRYVPLSEI